MKRTYHIILILLFACISGHAQMKKISDIDSFKMKVSKVASSIKSIESDFIQLKHMDIFNEDIKSEGKFYYKNDDKICLDYTKPNKYLIVINGEKIKTLSDGKKNLMNLKSNKIMKEMRIMLASCMSGNLSQISGYQMEYLEDAKTYLIKIKPTNKSIQEYVTGFDIYMDKKDLSVSKLRISEPGNNYTDYLFNNKTFNILNDDKIFSVL